MWYIGNKKNDFNTEYYRSHKLSKIDISNFIYLEYI